VQILGIPVLERPDHFVQQRARSLMPWRQRQRQEPLTPGCDPRTFTQDVIRYLSGVRTLKQEMELHGAQAALSDTPERRTEPRFSRHNVPWISVTRFGRGACCSRKCFLAGRAAANPDASRASLSEALRSQRARTIAPDDRTEWPRIRRHGSRHQVRSFADGCWDPVRDCVCLRRLGWPPPACD
jgi:hypothetical protein